MRFYAASVLAVVPAAASDCASALRITHTQQLAAPHVYLDYTYYVNILEDAYVCTWIIHTILTYLKMLMAVRV